MKAERAAVSPLLASSFNLDDVSSLIPQNCTDLGFLCENGKWVFGLMERKKEWEGMCPDKWGHR